MESKDSSSPIGTRPSHYPADARALVSWTDALREWCEKNAQPIRGGLSAVEVQELAKNL